jgi:cytochrome c oxidase subunit 1
VKIFNWLGTMWFGSLQFRTPMYFAVGFIAMFIIGGLSGVMHSSPPADLQQNDTYFIVAHFHYVMVGGTIMAYLGGLHYWWPKISGRLYPAFLSRLSALLVFVGFNLTFFPQFILGYLGMPRRYWSYPEEFQVFNVLSTAGATVLGVGYILPLCYFTWSMRYGKRSSENPWGAIGLEWDTPSPPPTENFHTIPVVTRGPYDYSPEEVHARRTEEVRVG